MVVIYVDVLFLVNFIIDSALLFCTGRLLCRKMSAWRILAGGGVGGIYSSVIFFISLPSPILFMCKIFASCAMVLISFSFRQIKEFVWGLVCFYISNFLLGGTLTALFNFSGKSGILKNGSLYFPLSFFQLMLMATPLILALLFTCTKLKDKLSGVEKDCMVTIGFGEKEVLIQGIIDSGSSLKEPISGLPVIVIGVGQAETLLSEQTAGLIKCGDLSRLIETGKFRLIPCRSVNSKNFLAGFFPDFAKILTSKGEKFCRCTIAISPDDFVEKAIVNPEVLL